MKQKTILNRTATHLLGLLLVVNAIAGWAAEPGSKPIFKEEHFDKDPGWDALNNRLKPDPKDIPLLDQNFGYSATNHAGGGNGEIGGKIWRSSTPAFYADKIPLKTLNDKLTASGRFVITESSGNAGIWFGWFNAGRQEVGTARPKSALGMDFDFQGDGARLSIRLVDDKDKGFGSFVTPYLPGEFRTTPLVKNVPYAWTLTYDPQANSGNGRIEFNIKCVSSNAHHDAVMKRLADDWKSVYEKSPGSQKKLDSGHYGRADFEGKPIVFDLPEGMKQEGASFDHFGILNIVKNGRSAEVYFDELQHDGKRENLAQDPGWEGLNNRARLQETMPVGYHNFGFSPDTHFAGGAPGEIGGIFWPLSQAYAYYADRIGPLGLDDPLEAHGRLLLKYVTPDCEMCFGWFNSSQKKPPENRYRQSVAAGMRRDPQTTHLCKTDHFLGVYLTSQHAGCGLLPALVTAKGTKINQRSGVPYAEPGKAWDWTIKYDPSAAGGKGVLSVTLGEQTATLTLDEKLRAEGASFDRFGFFASGGGGMTHIYFDDLKYTADRQ